MATALEIVLTIKFKIDYICTTTRLIATRLGWTPTCKLIWPFDHVVIWGRVANKKRYIYTSKIPMAPTLSKVAIHCKEPQPTESYDTLITSSDGKWKKRFNDGGFCWRAFIYKVT